MKPGAKGLRLLLLALLSVQTLFSFAIMIASVTVAVSMRSELAALTAALLLVCAVYMLARGAQMGLTSKIGCLCALVCLVYLLFSAYALFWFQQEMQAPYPWRMAGEGFGWTLIWVSLVTLPVLPATFVLWLFGALVDVMLHQSNSLAANWGFMAGSLVFGTLWYYHMPAGVARWIHEMRRPKEHNELMAAMKAQQE